MAEQFTVQRTIGHAGQDGIEIAFELTLTAFHRGYGQFGDVTSEVEGTIKLELELHACQITAIFGDKAGLPIEMGEARLVEPTMPLLGGIAIRDPDLGLMATHDVANNLARPGEVGGMDDGLS